MVVVVVARAHPPAKGAGRVGQPGKGIASDPDVHATDAEFWKNAKVVMPTPKEIVTMRLDGRVAQASDFACHQQIRRVPHPFAFFAKGWEPRTHAPTVSPPTAKTKTNKYP